MRLWMRVLYVARDCYFSFVLVVVFSTVMPALGYDPKIVGVSDIFGAG